MDGQLVSITPLNFNCNIFLWIRPLCNIIRACAGVPRGLRVTPEVHPVRGHLSHNRLGDEQVRVDLCSALLSLSISLVRSITLHFHLSPAINPSLSSTAWLNPLLLCSVIAIWEENKAKRKEENEKEGIVGIGSDDAAAEEVRNAEEGEAKAFDGKI